MNRPWSPKEDAQLRVGGKPRGRSTAAIRRRRDRLGLAARTPADDARVAQLVAEGRSSWAIADQLGVGYHTVLGIRTRLGLQAPRGRPRSKMREAQAEEHDFIPVPAVGQPVRVRITDGPPDLLDREGTLETLPNGGLRLVLDTASASTVSISTANYPATARTCGWCTHFFHRANGDYYCASRKPEAKAWFAAFCGPKGVLNCAAEDCPGFQQRMPRGTP